MPLQYFSSQELREERKTLRFSKIIKSYIPQKYDLLLSYTIYASFVSTTDLIRSRAFLTYFIAILNITSRNKV